LGKVFYPLKKGGFKSSASWSFETKESCHKYLPF
jgi:hypothetical protein